MTARGGGRSGEVDARGSGVHAPFPRAEGPFTRGETPFLRAEAPFTRGETPFPRAEGPFTSTENPFPRAETPSPLVRGSLLFGSLAVIARINVVDVGGEAVQSAESRVQSPSPAGCPPFSCHSLAALGMAVPDTLARPHYLPQSRKVVARIKGGPPAASRRVGKVGPPAHRPWDFNVANLPCSCSLAFHGLTSPQAEVCSIR